MRHMKSPSLNIAVNHDGAPSMPCHWRILIWGHPGGLVPGKHCKWCHFLDFIFPFFERMETHSAWSLSQSFPRRGEAAPEQVQTSAGSLAASPAAPARQVAGRPASETLLGARAACDHSTSPHRELSQMQCVFSELGPLLFISLRSLTLGQDSLSCK